MLSSERNFLGLATHTVASFGVALLVATTLTGCMSSAREEALRVEMASLRQDLATLRSQTTTSNASVSKLRTTADSSTRWVQETKQIIEEMRGELRVMRGNFSELQVKLERMEKNGGGGREDSTTLDMRESVAQQQATIRTLERRLLRMEFGGGSHTSGKGKTDLDPTKLEKSLRDALAARQYTNAASTATLYLKAKESDGKVREVALRYRGEAYFLKRQYEDAARDFLDFLSEFSRSENRPRVLLFAGDSFVFLKRLDVAKGMYEECLQLSAPDSEVYQSTQERLRRLGS